MESSKVSFLRGKRTKFILLLSLLVSLGSCGKKSSSKIALGFSGSEVLLIPANTNVCGNSLSSNYFLLPDPRVGWSDTANDLYIVGITVTLPIEDGTEFSCTIAGEALTNLFQGPPDPEAPSSDGQPVVIQPNTTLPAKCALGCGGVSIPANRRVQGLGRVKLIGYSQSRDAAKIQKSQTAETTFSFSSVF